MNKSKRKIAVTSRSFSCNEILRAELDAVYSFVKYNETGKKINGDALFEFLSDCDSAIVGLENVDSKLLERLPGLKVISKYGVGLDAIDLLAMRRLDVSLGWTPGVNKRSVSELALGMMIGLLRNIPESNKELNAGVWRQHVGQLLTGKKVGIIGLGNVGKDLAILLKAFDCKLYAYDINIDNKFIKDNSILFTSMEKLLSNSDIVTLHIPLDESTKNILNRDKLNYFKKNSILINVARGGLVDESELYIKLKEGRIAGAAFDVFEYEPPNNCKLLELSNFIATPHIGGSSEEAILAMGRAAIKGLENNYIP
jgi:D-3-phosphoglycerate dehydrogenase